MIRLIDVEKDLGSYLESNKNIQIKIKNKDMHPASFLIEPNPYFCGRDEILNDIKIQFENDNKQIVSAKHFFILLNKRSSKIWTFVDG